MLCCLSASVFFGSISDESDPNFLSHSRQLSVNNLILAIAERPPFAPALWRRVLKTSASHPLKISLQRKAVIRLRWNTSTAQLLWDLGNRAVSALGHFWAFRGQ